MSQKEPLVSIITPTYNHEKYIGECIESVKNQTFSNWEMIIINDGSTDKTYEIAKITAAGDSRIQVINQQNKGIFRLDEAYNYALKISKGEYIAILEGDDYWEHDKLEIQVNALEIDKSVVMGWGKAASRVAFQKEIYQVHPVSSSKNLSFYFNNPPGTIFNAVFDDFFPPLTYIIRKDALLKIGGFIQVLPFPAVDLSTVLALSKLGTFHFSDCILGTWRIFPEQTTKTLGVDIFEGGNKIIVNHYRSLTENEKSRINFTEKEIFKSYHKRKVIAFSRSGRFKLIKRDFKGARKDYLISLKYKGLIEPAWKLRSLTGLVFSFLHFDVELLAKWVGKGSLKQKTK